MLKGQLLNVMKNSKGMSLTMGQSREKEPKDIGLSFDLSTAALEELFDLSTAALWRPAY